MDIHIHRLMEGICEVRHSVGAGAIIYMPSFVNIDSGMQKLIRGRGGTQTRRMEIS
jgi:hypothetical protein